MSAHEPDFSEYVEPDLSAVEPSFARPKRPQDRVSLAGARGAFRTALAREPQDVDGPGVALRDEAVVAAITSCTNTSNLAFLVAAGLVAKRAVERGPVAKPWVRTPLAPGSRVVRDYLERAGLVESLDQPGFYLASFGCTTCNRNTGPLLEGVGETVTAHDLSVVSVLSGNRNFEGRIDLDVKQNYPASPPLVVAYALAGTIDIDLWSEPLGGDANAQPVYLADSVTTDHIAPAGDIRPTVPAGLYLTEHGVAREDFNSCGTRRGNHEFMMRGTFANIRLRNQLAPGTEGVVMVKPPEGEPTTIYDADVDAAAGETPSSSWVARSAGAGQSATGPRRTPGCSVRGPSSSSPSSASTARTSWAWACCLCSSCPENRPRARALPAPMSSTSSASSPSIGARRFRG